ncbi:hypothetical protein BGX23_001981 [Mortierella sp. AD031]|nr:hypothetical protein BGX23_001981 [Mortierella sp. AD031]
MSDRKLPMDKSERILAEQLRIPVNTICCDCGTANPNWASYSLGCFLCVRCCSVHRKMGTHISKVKSVTLDSWTQDDIDTMKNWGNGKVNALYMPHPERHPPPTSMEGSAMEQYIRSKYERKEFMEGGGNYQPSGRSAYGNTFSGGRGTGSRNDVVNSQNYPTQMSALRAMGFRDNAKNLQVLQSTNGDVPNAIEILCRIGQGPVSSTPNVSSNNSRTYTRPSPSSNTNNSSSNNNNNNSRSNDPKEAILWNMGFHDSALNKEALRRAGGNPDVAAALLIDEKDKLAKAVREKGSSSPLPDRLDPPGSNNKPKNEDNLLLDLSNDDDQQQQQQQRMFQQQMQMQNTFGNSNQQWSQQNSGLDQFGQNHNQLQSILNKNEQILALYNNETNNNNNNMNSNNMFGNNGMNNMNSAFGLQQQQTGLNDMNSWAMNNNNNNQMSPAFGLQTSMATGNANMFGNNNMMNQNASSMGIGTMGMNSLQQQQQQQQQINPFGAVSAASQQSTGNAFGNNNNMFNTNNNNSQFAGMGGNNNGLVGSPMSPFNTLSSNTNNANNNNMFGNMSSNPMGNMGNMGNAGMNSMNGGFNNNNSPFGMNNNNNNNNFNTNNNGNPWGNNNNNLF